MELNAEKTHTLHASSAVARAWSIELREHRFSNYARTQARSLEHYFTRSFEFTNQYPRDNGINYGVKRTRNLEVKQENRRSYETFLLRAARANATAIPTVAEILVSYNHLSYQLYKERIQKLLTDRIKRNTPPARHAEVAWALFLAKALRIVVSREVSKAVGQLESSVCDLLVLDLEQSGLVEGALEKSIWRRSMSGQGLHSSMWLLAHQADLKGWLNGSSNNFVDDDPYFAPLKPRGISFYDIKKNVTRIRRLRPRPPAAAVC